MNKEDTLTMSIRGEMLRLAKEAAAAKGIPVKVYIKDVLRWYLDEEEANKKRFA